MSVNKQHAKLDKLKNVLRKSLDAFNTIVMSLAYLCVMLFILFTIAMVIWIIFSSLDKAING